MKKAVFITAPEIFRDEEYEKPKKILENNGIKVITVSTKKGEIKGKLGMKAVSDMTIDEVAADDFDAIVYVGGAGAGIFFENPVALKLARDFVSSGKPAAAICIAPTILANAGVLKGKAATVFPDGRAALEKGGAKYTSNTVETDGNIITGNGPDAAEEFGQALLKALRK